MGTVPEDLDLDLDLDLNLNLNLNQQNRTPGRLRATDSLSERTS